jgi:hypothetical protein
VAGFVELARGLVAWMGGLMVESVESGEREIERERERKREKRDIVNSRLDVRTAFCMMLKV